MRRSSHLLLLALIALFLISLVVIYTPGHQYNHAQYVWLGIAGLFFLIGLVLSAFRGYYRVLGILGRFLQAISVVTAIIVNLCALFQ